MKILIDKHNILIVQKCKLFKDIFLKSKIPISQLITIFSVNKNIHMFTL